MARILLTHSPEERRTRFPDDVTEKLAARGDLRLNETGEVLGTEALIELAQGCDVVVADRLTPAEAEFFSGVPDLVALCRSAVDIRNIDLDAASRHGVLVTRASPLFIDAVAELAFALMIDCARHVSDAVVDYRAGRLPEARMGMQLAGAALGVIGYGAIGRRVAEIGHFLGMRVLVTDPYVAEIAHGLERTGLEDLLAQSDVVVCLAVANAQTDRLIDTAALALMKPTACFVNLSRGSLVDEAALDHALRTGVIAGAALDVGLDPGQMPPLRIASLPNVVATPHIGGLTVQGVAGQAEETVAQVAEILAGRVPHNALNAGKATRFPGRPVRPAP